MLVIGLSSPRLASASEMVETELGTLRMSTIQGVCQAEIVYVGRVHPHTKSRKEVWFPTPTNKRTRVMTDFKFTVERHVRGKNAKYEYLTIAGGSADGMTMWTSMSHRMPEPVVGRRYLIAESLAWDGSRVLNAVARIADDATLPSLAKIENYIGTWQGVYCE